MRRALLLLLLAGCADFRVETLGTPGQPEWEDLAGAAGREATFDFEAAPNAGEHTALVWQDNVRHIWNLQLNGKPLGRLQQYEFPVLSAFPIAPGALTQGRNVVSVRPPKDKDDIRVGLVRVIPKPLQDWLAESSLEIRIADSGPARITIVDEASEALMPVAALPGQRLAVRTGCVYTADGLARLTLPAGRYRVSAGRGFEYSIAQSSVTLEAGASRTLDLDVRREVETSGLVACDTHLHTVQFSGHGDATAVERAITLAGEGIELAVCTEHNQHASYVDAVRAAGVDSRLTVVPGNEVTTPKGHFNVFPVAPGAPVPDSKLTDWPRLMDVLRGTPGVRVVILNHPRNKHSDFIPFAPEHYDALTGENRRGFPFTFDAMELVNSSALRTDDLLVFRDWLALLNAGTRVAGVGSSDCHEVNRYIVGQGRTYVEVPDGDPSRIDVEAACAAIRQGRSSVSLGLLTRLRVEGSGSGSQIQAKAPELAVEVTVSGPSWTRADWAGLYVNGRLVHEVSIGGSGKAGGEKARLLWRIPRPPNDAHVVAVASGPGVRDLHWPLSRPYQPESPAWAPIVLGIANPVWIDADGDGQWTSPRALGAELVGRYGADLKGLIAALGRFDEAVAVQAAALLREQGRSPGAKLLEGAAEAVRRGFAAR